MLHGAYKTKQKCTYWESHNLLRKLLARHAGCPQTASQKKQ